MLLEIMQHEAGFENLVEQNAHLDLGEWLVLLRGFRVVPSWVTADEVQSLFARVRLVVVCRNRSPHMASDFFCCIPHVSFYAHVVFPQKGTAVVVVEQARFHVPVVRANSTWEEKDKAAGLLNYREFLVCQLLMFLTMGLLISCCVYLAWPAVFF
jgi:hypothetical protein